jgi:5-hydroxyisourate hydrolase-like protein (transthyretin family)
MSMPHQDTTTVNSFSISYRNKHTITIASICFLSLMSLSAKNAAAQDLNASKGASSVSGRVLIHGKPAPGLELALLPDRNHLSDQPLAKVTTNEDGRYNFTNLPAGHYWIRVQSRQYVSLDQRNWQGTGRTVSVPAGTTATDTDIDLTLGGVVSGRITDADGNAVADEWVHLFAVTNYGPSLQVPSLYAEEFKTNSNGEYRISGIPSGRYLVGVGVDIARLTGAVMDKNDYFSAQGRVGTSRYFAQMFYPGTPEQAQAHAIEISLEAEVKGIDMTVGRPQRSFAARGHVIDAETGKPLEGKRRLQVSHRTPGGYLGTIADDQVNEDGSFEIAGLLSERFFASVDFKGDTELYGDKVEFEIKDADVNGLEIRAYHGFTLSGDVVIEGETNADALAKRAQLKLTASSPIRGGEYAYMHREMGVNADGTFKFIGLPRGPVEISAVFCDTCGFFALDRIEYPKKNGKGEMQLAQPGWTDGYRLIEVDHNLKGMRIVLHYKGASILCHVDVVGTLPLGVRLMVDIDTGIGKGGWAGWREIDANGDMLQTGLEPGNCNLTIGDGNRRFTETKRITVPKNQQTKISFTVDASKIPRRD